MQGKGRCPDTFAGTEWKERWTKSDVTGLRDMDGQRPWFEFSTGTGTANQLLLLGVKAKCLSLRRGDGRRPIFTSTGAAEEWLPDGLKGSPSHCWARLVT